MKRNKKGISLAIVIVVVMALMIFSAMLFSAASHSLSMTGESTDGRQAYLTAKSAIEFSKTTAFNLAKADNLKPFAVTIGADGSFAQDAGISPDSVAGLNLDGTKDCAKCWNTGGNTWKMLANIKYKNSAKFRQLAYTFTLTPNVSVNLPASNFMAAGFNYGMQNVYDNHENWPEFFSITSSPSGTSVYPVSEEHTVYSNTSKGYVKAPELFFSGATVVDGQPASIYCYNGTSGLIYSNYIVIANNIGSQYDANTATSLKLFRTDNSSMPGIIYFAGKSNGVCSISHGSTVTIPAGYYQFDAGIDLLKLTAMANGNFQESGIRNLTKLTQAQLSADSMKSFQRDLSFITTCYTNKDSGVIYGGPNGKYGANFESDGVFGSIGPSSKKDNAGHWNIWNTTAMEEKTVFTYATSVQWLSSCPYPQYDTANGDNYIWSGAYSIYCAKQFFLRFVSSSNDFVLPGSYNAVFHSDLVSLSMAASDTNAGASADSRPKIVQADNATSSQFLLTSLSTDVSGNHKDVTLAVQNDLRVIYSGGSYVIPSGIYSVPSGFNFFDSKIIGSSNWSSYWTRYRKGGYPVSGSGGSGGAGGFTITPGAYSGS